MKKYICVETKIQPFYLVEENGQLISIDFEKSMVVNFKEEETIFLKKAKTQLLEYMDGKRICFDLELGLSGTPFQKKVWEALIQVEYGHVATYKQVALMIGNPKAFRAVGMACNKNAIPIIIPCHRIVGSNNQLIGYAGGLAIKEQLLKHEGYLK